MQPARLFRSLLATSLIFAGAASGTAAGAAAETASAAAAAVAPPAPVPPLPTFAQQRWHETEIISIICHGLNPYTGKEWGYGNEPATLFNPPALNLAQIIGTLKSGEIKGVVLVAKHHDGFCLWPTKTTAHSIASSPWRGGRGDLVREYADAARSAGLLFGLYCSPWDRNHPEYGRPAYVAAFHEQLRELCENYGDLFEVWFDGANGGDGYYGGAKETRKITGDYYRWQRVFDIIRSRQPDAAIFGFGGDARWVGNELGYADPESWPTTRSKTPRRDKETPQHGARNGTKWEPAECDVPLRRGWFWRASEDKYVRPPAKLFDIYLNSVGKGGLMNLGSAPDASGRLCDADVRAITGFGELLRATFGKNLAAGATATASNTRGEWGATNTTDGDRYTYWATADGVTTGELVLTLPAPVTFNIVRLRENIRLGHRVGRFAVDIFENGAWREIHTGEAIAANRLLWTREVKGQGTEKEQGTAKGQGTETGAGAGTAVNYTTNRVRLRVLEARAPLAISDFSLFLAPPAAWK
ncbi:MAG: alpha-L-fucosidase [Puniceicoccales bacterium]|jgi:alpha-L-fucosidase|nr:alpha-L-fucosidase [Puniceicoccales bacterium]